VNNPPGRSMTDGEIVAFDWYTWFSRAVCTWITLSSMAKPCLSEFANSTWRGSLRN